MTFILWELLKNELTYLLTRAFASAHSAQVPATKEPTGLSRSEGRRPDGMTLIP